MPRPACLPLAFTVLAHATLSVDARARTTAPLLSFYDFDPASQSELLPGMVDFGIDPPIDCMLGGYYGYGIPGLFRLGRYNITWGDCWPKSENGTSLLVQHGLPQSQIFAEKGLFKNWRANVALTASMIKPLMAAGAVKGVFLGDEQVCGGHQTMAEVAQVSDALREELGPDAILYYNEGGCQPYAIPASLTYYSLDSYATGAAEVANVRKCYEQNVFPHLNGTTKAFVVPGLFGNPTKNVTLQEDQLVEKVTAYGAWMANETRIAGMNPWHYSTRQNSGYPHDKYPFGMGVVDFPRVVAALREMKEAYGTPARREDLV